MKSDTPITLCPTLTHTITKWASITANPCIIIIKQNEHNIFPQLQAKWIYLPIAAMGNATGFAIYIYRKVLMTTIVWSHTNDPTAFSSFALH